MGITSTHTAVVENCCSVSWSVSDLFCFCLQAHSSRRRYDEASNTFYRQMDELNKFMKEKGLPHELRVKLRDYFRFRRNSRAIVEWSNVMYLMSDSLRLEVADNVFGKWVRAMPIFKDCPRRLPGMLAAHLSSLVLGPHEVGCLELETKNRPE